MDTVAKPVTSLKQVSVTPIVKGRRGKYTPEVTPQVRLNKRSHYDWVRVDSLLIDPAYQRNIEKQRLNEMHHNFNAELLGTIVVSKRENGYLYVVDGQHRHQLLQILDTPPEEVYCEIFEGLTVEEEAYLFYLLDTKRKALTSRDAFKARLVAGETLAVALNQCAKAVGLTIDVNRGQQPNNIQAIYQVETIYKRQGPEGLMEILNFAHTAWPEESTALSGKILKGLEVFLARYGDVADFKRLMKILQSVTAQQLITKGRVIEGSMSLSIPESIGFAITQMYNHNLRVNRLPEWVFSQEE